MGFFGDPYFGPMVIFASGGILIELVNDRTFALAPVDDVQANALLGSLKLSKLLDGLRGQDPVDRQSLVSLD